MNDNDKKRTEQLKELIDDAKSEGEITFAASAAPKNKIEREKIKNLFLKSIERGDYVITENDILLKVPKEDEIGFRAWLKEESTDLERKDALKSLIEEKDTKKDIKVSFRGNMVQNENYKGECE